MNRRILHVLTTLTALLIPATSTLAQRGGFSADGFFDRLDEDGSGVIEPEEIENSRMRRWVERLEIDTSRGITREQFSNAMDEVRQRYEQERESYRSEGDDERPDDDRRSRWSRSEDSERDRSDRGRERRTESPTRGRSTSPTPVVQQRVTIDLQSEFAEGDRDGDGQIGMYEWTQWKSRSALAEFLGMDRNRDGFLTPRELTRAAEAEPVDIASVLPIATEAASVVAESQSVPSAEGATQSTPETSASTSRIEIANAAEVIAAADPGQVKQAERLFALLDRDRDGTVTELEWARSQRLKPRYEAAGANLTEPMSSDQFVSYYVRIFASSHSGD
ncbi:MAG: hypothetical protein KDA93_05945 [Planctomycetaceae bacterium]|nr:hypothetical protein [Planctomycetaceae bacterium]